MASRTSRSPPPLLGAESDQKTRGGTVGVISHLWDRKWESASLSWRDNDAKGRAWRYLEIINHIVTRRADEEREERARGEGNERLHGLIWHLNQFQVINYGPCPPPPPSPPSRDHRQRASESHRGPLSEAYNAVSTRSATTLSPRSSLIII